MFSTPPVVHLQVVKLSGPSHTPHVFDQGGPGEGGAPYAVSRYLYGYDDPRSWWVLQGAQLVLLQPGWLLSAYAAEQGIPGDGSVVFVRPGVDPLGLRRLCAADFNYIDYIHDIHYVDDSDSKDKAVMALSPARASDQDRKEALLDEGDAYWTSLPPLPPPPPERRPFRQH